MTRIGNSARAAKASEFSLLFWFSDYVLSKIVIMCLLAIWALKLSRVFAQIYRDMNRPLRIVGQFTHN